MLQHPFFIPKSIESDPIDSAEKKQRQENYRALFQAHVSEKLLKEMRNTVNKGLALGDGRLKKEIEELTKQRVTARKAGRPKKEDGSNY